MEPESLRLTPLDNFLPQLAEYVPNIFFFPDTGIDQASTIENLRVSLAQTIKAIPWLSGSVRYIQHRSLHGRNAIAAPWRTADDLLTVKHLRNIDYTVLKAENFPMKYLDENEVWPESPWADQPTMQAQINFVKHGIILAVRFRHCVTDGHGAAMITKVWATYCRGEDGSLCLRSDVMDRERLMHGIPTNLHAFRACKELPPSRPENGHGSSKLCHSLSCKMNTICDSGLKIVSDLITFRSVGKALRTRKPRDDGESRVETFFFPAKKLQELKETVIAVKNFDGRKEKGEEAWVSTHDVLVSLLWCCITNVWKNADYLHRDENTNPGIRMLYQAALRTAQPVSMLSIFINARRLNTDPPLHSYMGNLVLMSIIARPFKSVNPTMDSVAENAYALRGKVLELDEDYLMRNIGALDSAPDFTRLKIRNSPFPQSTIVINSWASMDYYATDWGSKVGGRPERIRMSQSPHEPYGQVMPKLDARDGWKDDECGLEVMVNLKSKIMQRLMQDELLNRFGEWRCS